MDGGPTSVHPHHRGADGGVICLLEHRVVRTTGQQETDSPHHFPSSGLICLASCVCASLDASLPKVMPHGMSSFLHGLLPHQPWTEHVKLNTHTTIQALCFLASGLFGDSSDTPVQSKAHLLPGL